MAKQDYISFVTPLGRARYPKLDKQDMYEGKEVGYKLDIIFDDADLAKVQAFIDDAVSKLAPNGKLAKNKQTPIREDKDGNSFFTAKSYNKVPLFGTKGNVKLPDTTIVGGGSTVRAKVSVKIGNGHLVAYLNSVQVAELKSGSGDGFDDLDGFEDNTDGAFDDVAGNGDDLDI